MTKQRSPRNRRRSPRRRSNNILEVQVRARTARQKRVRLVTKIVWSLILIVVIGTAGIYGIRAGMSKFFLNNPDYKIKALEVQLDGVMTRDELIKLAEIEADDNLFTLNISQIEQRLRSDARIENVRIERHFPNELSITLTRRRPVAWVSKEDVQSGTGNQDAAMLIAADGTLMPPMPGYGIHTGYLPTIFGGTLEVDSIKKRISDSTVYAALDLIAAVDKNTEAIFQIRTIDVSKPYRLGVITDRNIHVQFPPEDFDEQVDRLNQIMKMAIDTGRELQTVNLLIKKNTPVTFVQPVVSQKRSDAVVVDAKKSTKKSTKHLPPNPKTR